MAKVGGMAEEDPRLELKLAESPQNPTGDFIRPQHRPLYDSSVSFEEYLYYAERTRADQKESSALEERNKIPILRIIFPPKTNKVELDDKMAHLNTNVASTRAGITDEEWTSASKAMRNATAMAIFYLLTTDVLGPFGLPYAVATTGWG